MEDRIPLLSHRFPSDGTAGIGGGGGDQKEDGGVGGCNRWWGGLAPEVGKVGSMALPMAAMSVAQNAVQVASNMMVGHLPGVLPLSASAIATSLASVSGFSLLVGMASGLETICGQAYGAKQFDKLGVQTYRAIVTLTVVTIPISLLWVFIGKLLTLIGQDPLIAQEAGRYIVWLIPGLFAYAVCQPLTKFLQSQGLIFPMLWSSIATLLLHIPLSWLLVFKTSLGFTGAALAISISYWLNTFMLVAYIRFSCACKVTRSPPTIEAFRSVGLFLRLALPSALMLCFEWWSFEILILLSGLLPNPELESSVLSLCLTTTSLMYTIPYGLGGAASTRVANELGAGNPEGARSAVQLVMSIAGTEAVLVTGTLFASQRILGYAYSSDKEVVTYFTSMVPFVCISVAADSLQGVLSVVSRPQVASYFQSCRYRKDIPGNLPLLVVPLFDETNAILCCGSRHCYSGSYLFVPSNMCSYVEHGWWCLHQHASISDVVLSVDSTSLSVARGCGWQHLGAYVNLGSFYLVGIPVALLLGFGLKMEGRGLWLGIACGSVLQFLLLAVIAFFSDWQKMAEKVRERIFSETPSEKQHLVLDATNSV